MRKEDLSLVWKQVFLFSSRVKSSSCQRHQKQQSAEVSERPRAQSMDWLHDSRLTAAAKGGVRAWGENCEEGNGETIKTSPLNFPTLPFSFLLVLQTLLWLSFPLHRNFQFCLNLRSCDSALVQAWRARKEQFLHIERGLSERAFSTILTDPKPQKKDWVDKMQISVMQASPSELVG